MIEKKIVLIILIEITRIEKKTFHKLKGLMVYLIISL